MPCAHQHLQKLEMNVTIYRLLLPHGSMLISNVKTKMRNLRNFINIQTAYCVNILWSAEEREEIFGLEACSIGLRTVGHGVNIHKIFYVPQITNVSLGYNGRDMAYQSFSQMKPG